MSLLYNIRQYGKNSKSIKSAICEREYGILNLIKFKIAPANPYGFQLQQLKLKAISYSELLPATARPEARCYGHSRTSSITVGYSMRCPTTASINAMYLRLQKLFGDRNPILWACFTLIPSARFILFSKKKTRIIP